VIGNGNGTVVVDSSMDSLKVEPDSCDDDEVIGVKVEEVTIKEEGFTVKEEDVTVVKEEEDPLLMQVPLIQRECEVSFLTVSSQYCRVLTVCEVREYLLSFGAESSSLLSKNLKTKIYRTNFACCFVGV
jgi:methyl coenzyme M reductase subunit C-like uncharacterized protein (methanogenesis marker protein 7)